MYHVCRNWLSAIAVKLLRHQLHKSYSCRDGHETYVCLKKMYHVCRNWLLAIAAKLLRRQLHKSYSCRDGRETYV